MKSATPANVVPLLPDWELPGWITGDESTGFTPLADVEETPDAYLVEVELPGISRGDIDVSLAGRTLTITAERKERERVGVLRRRTRVTGRLRYTVALPAIDPNADVEAGYDEGVLTVRVPKAARERPRRIRVH